MIEGEIEGQEIERLYLPDCGFENKFIYVKLDSGELCKMKLSEFNKVLSFLKFRAIPKRKYSHLIITEQEPDPEECIFEY